MYTTERLLITLFQEKEPQVGLGLAAEADFYFVPQLSTCHYHHCIFELHEPPDVCKESAARYLEAILDHIQQEHPFWNSSAGGDHVFVFPWDQASEVLGFHSRAKQRVAHSVHLTPLGAVRDLLLSFLFPFSLSISLALIICLLI